MCNTRADLNASIRAEGASGEDALSEEFLCHVYKVVPCSRRYPHDWASCPCGHKGERAARRDLKTHLYSAIACSHAKQRQTCPRGDSCPHAHNLFEYWLHPQRYRTELCQFGSSCERPVCFFAHGFDELRLLDARLPPAESCWSAGAAVSANSRAQAQAASFQQQQQQLAMGASASAFAEAAAAAAAAAAQMQATACSSSGLQQLYAAQMPVSSLGLAANPSILLLHQQHLPLLASQQQQLQESPLQQALLPAGLTAPNFWPGASAPDQFADMACSSGSTISSNWSTSSMVDGSIIHMSPSNMLHLPATTLPGSGPHSPACLQPPPIPPTVGSTSSGIWAAHALGLVGSTPAAPQPHQQQQPAHLQPAHLHSMAGMLSALQELQLRHYAI